MCLAAGLAVAALWAPPVEAAQQPPAPPLEPSTAAPAQRPAGMGSSPATSPPAPASSPQPSSPAAASSPPPASSPPASSSAEAAAKQQRIERAKALHDEARTLYQHGAYRAAILRLEAAAALDPEGKELVYNLAVIHEKLGEIERAEDYFRRYLEMEALPKEREEVEAILKRLAGAKRELAGPRAPALPSRSPSTRPEALQSSFYSAPAGARASSGGGPWVLVSGGIAAGSLVIGGVFASLAVAKDPGSRPRTGGGVTIADLQADASAAHRCAVVADIALVVAGLSGVAALAMYLSPSEPAAGQPAQQPLRQAPRARSQETAGVLPARRLREAQGEPWIAMSLGAEGAQLRVWF